MSSNGPQLLYLVMSSNGPQLLYLVMNSTTLCEKLYFLLFVQHCFLNILCFMTSSICFSDLKYVGTVYLVDSVDDLVASTRSDLILLY